MFSQLMETAEPWFSTFEHDGQKVIIIQIFSMYLREQMISVNKSVKLKNKSHYYCYKNKYIKMPVK